MEDDLILQLLGNSGCWESWRLVQAFVMELIEEKLRSNKVMTWLCVRSNDPSSEHN